MTHLIRSKAQALLLAATLIVSVATFAVVQDRVTASGARRYVALQREAAAGRGRAETIEEVMRPAIRDSVRLGALSGGGVLLVGVVLLAIVRRRDAPRWTATPRG